ncbi:MAG: ribbon-helix-helix domain-containing protein [Nanoarchaeota archaeon]|nr:ribbon-helix-helix domain-containing protein [Nanoarchaeota archaeon]MBU1030282.1 ribbon-helix-helix domain-containing protein [Nanoarchaeota archaeon]MBU1850055.1 ribbon-helix-helix domain-containing protein [Nanoarchaeota archaeon]
MQKPQIETEVLNVRLPESTIEILDQFIEKKIFSSRSEAIREFAREYILENNIKQ